MDSYRIIAVCLGNICRSPMAEAVLKERIAAAGLDEAVEIQSAGTGHWHVGHHPDPRAVQALARRGYSVDHVARRIRRADIGAADLVLAMDRWNMTDLRELVGDSDDVTRIRLMRSYDRGLAHLPEDDQALDIPDPYYGSDADFGVALDMLEAASAGVVDQVRIGLSR